MLKSNLEREVEFIIEVPESGEHPPEPVPFEITPETLENVRKSSVTQIPPFKLAGKLFRTNCSLSDPFKGSIVVEKSKAAIRSIELQLVRVETVAYAEGQAREATEIQNVQVADGDVSRDLVIPLYMVFPRLFVCPMVDTLNWRPSLKSMVAQVTGTWYVFSESHTEAAETAVGRDSAEGSGAEAEAVSGGRERRELGGGRQMNRIL